MSEMDSPHKSTPMLSRVRCGQCQFPLVRLYQGDFLSPLQQQGEQTIPQPMPVYSYRVLTDATPLLCCPRCQMILSPATVTPVPPGILVTEESKAVPRPNE